MFAKTSNNHDAHVLAWIESIAACNAFVAHDQRREYPSAAEAKASYLVNVLDTLVEYGIRGRRETAVAAFLRVYPLQGAKFRAGRTR